MVTERCTSFKLMIFLVLGNVQDDQKVSVHLMINNTESRCIETFWSPCIVFCISASGIGIIFKLRNFPGIETYRCEIISTFSICWMFNFSVLFFKNYWRHWSCLLVPLVFHHSQVMWELVTLILLFLSLSLQCSMFLLYFFLGAMVAQWLRSCATNWKVAGQWIFHWHKILLISLWP